jgi:hypothetical protein
MCWQAALPAILGTGAQMIGQRQTDRSADREASRRMREGVESGRKGGQLVDEQIKKVAESGPEADREAANADFMAALQKARQSDKGALSDSNVGGSDRFETESVAARGDTAAEGRHMADTAARVDAPQFQRMREGRQFNDSAANLDILKRRAAGEDFMSQLRLARIRPNAGLQAFGQAAQGYGQARAGRALPVKRPANSGFVGPI